MTALSPSVSIESVSAFTTELLRDEVTIIDMIAPVTMGLYGTMLTHISDPADFENIDRLGYERPSIQTQSYESRVHTSSLQASTYLIDITAFTTYGPYTEEVIRNTSAKIPGYKTSDHYDSMPTGDRYKQQMNDFGNRDWRPVALNCGLSAPEIGMIDAQRKQVSQMNIIGSFLYFQSLTADTKDPSGTVRTYIEDGVHIVPGPVDRMDNPIDGLNLKYLNLLISATASHNTTPCPMYTSSGQLITSYTFIPTRNISDLQDDAEATNGAVAVGMSGMIYPVQSGWDNISSATLSGTRGLNGSAIIGVSANVGTSRFTTMDQQGIVIGMPGSFKLSTPVFCVGYEAAKGYANPIVRPSGGVVSTFGNRALVINPDLSTMNTYYVMARQNLGYTRVDGKRVSVMFITLPITDEEAEGLLSQAIIPRTYSGERLGLDGRATFKHTVVDELGNSNEIDYSGCRTSFRRNSHLYANTLVSFDTVYRDPATGGVYRVKIDRGVVKSITPALRGDLEDQDALLRDRHSVEAARKERLLAEKVKLEKDIAQNEKSQRQTQAKKGVTA